MDRRVIRTKKAIRSALFKLMESKDISSITISELTALANVNRRTFYTHYSNITDILDETEAEIVEALQQLIRFQPVAGPVCQLQIIQVAWVPTLGNRYDMVNAGGQWMRIAQVLVHRLSTDAAYCLCGHDLCLVPIECQTVGAVLVRAVAF